MEKLINYFINRPLIANALMFGFIFMAIIVWEKIGKEEMPEFAMNHVRAVIRYPGASAEDVELFITKPVEEKLKGVSAMEEVISTSSFGSSSFKISLEPNLPDLQEKIQEVKDAIDSVELPREAEDPVYRQFKSSEKAIIDVGIFLKETQFLDVKSRAELQSYALAFKNKILTLPEISGVDVTGYLRPELQIKVRPELLKTFEISLNQIKEQVISQNVRQPIGSMKDASETDVSIVSELNDVDSLEKVIVSAGFQGQSLMLSELAKIENGFEESTTINKVQGREGIVFNIKKSSKVDILSAQKVVVNFIETFKKNNLDSPVDFVLIDDESYDVRNRLSLIGTNGLIGFILIVLVLFFFLDFKSGIWVAMGVPFSLAFTLIMASALGFTINNMTLAAIIIVLGIVVDDAIIVSENISRHLKFDKSFNNVKSVLEVGAPVIASVLTTCAAFIPLYYFSGRFGMFVKSIPTIIFLMLFASLVESFFILPSHMVQPSRLEGFFRKFKFAQWVTHSRVKLIMTMEAYYSSFLEKILSFKYLVLSGFLVLLLASLYLFQNHLKYVMFPREESRNFRVKVVAPENTKRLEMAKLIRSVEDVFLKDLNNVVTSVRTTIGQNRRGGEVTENEGSIRVEVVPPSEREKSLNSLILSWEKQTNALVGFDKIKFQKSRFGSDSGSPIEIEVQENNDQSRKILVEKLKQNLDQVAALINVEVERPVTKPEFKLKINRAETSRLGINTEQLSATLRAYIQGDILYTLNSGEEEVDVRFTSLDESKNDIQKILNLTVANKGNYLVPIKNLVTVIENRKPSNIHRVNFKRATTIYADIKPGVGKTPLEIAEQLETKVFPKTLKGIPSANVVFRGEVEDSRESQSEFLLSIVLVLTLIYLILLFLFDSVWMPFLIGAIIPFGVVGATVAFWMHNMPYYGFFAVVGTLGMIGVVINDSIVLIDKLNSKLFKNVGPGFHLNREIAKISASRLRAIIITTLTTIAGLFPTAYGLGGYDSMLAEMMLAMGWGLLFGMLITLLLVPCLYVIFAQFKLRRLEGGYDL